VEELKVLREMEGAEVADLVATGCFGGLNDIKSEELGRLLAAAAPLAVAEVAFSLSMTVGVFKVFTSEKEAGRWTIFAAEGRGDRGSRFLPANIGENIPGVDGGREEIPQRTSGGVVVVEENRRKLSAIFL